MVIFLVRLQMLVQMIDAFRKQRNLYLRRTRIALVQPVRRNDFLFSLFCHNKSPLFPKSPQSWERLEFPASAKAVSPVIVAHFRLAVKQAVTRAPAYRRT